MLKTVDLINGIDEEYHSMLKLVNIPDFIKCVSIFSGYSLDAIDDNTIKNYLQTWAINKFHIFKLLGNKLIKDIPFTYKKMHDDHETEYNHLIAEYPAFGPWLSEFSRFEHNKINERNYSYRLNNFRKYTGDLNYEGMSITHFAKKHLKFPEEVITKIARIYENDEIVATYTLSIDPIDIMTASENPYSWTSCYRLETENISSHADGVMAAVLDTSSIISYIWTKEGNYSLYNKYEIKKLRYKQMRQWVAVSDDFTNVAFCDIYPSKDYPQPFYKQIRLIVEKLLANYLQLPDKWHSTDLQPHREHNEYGYNEYNNPIYCLKDKEQKNIYVYSEPILCPCGCGTVLKGNYGYDDDYLGAGFNHEGWEEGVWCEYCQDYCREDCVDCSYWRDAHPLCGLDNDEECNYYNHNHIVSDGICKCDKINCNNCPRWIEYQNEIKLEEDKIVEVSASNVNKLLADGLKENTQLTTIKVIDEQEKSSIYCINTSNLNLINDTWNRITATSHNTASTITDYVPYNPSI